MMKARIIPCLDVKDGRVVKGVNFVNLADAGDPVEQARLYDGAGADELCFLDINASHEGRKTTLDAVQRVAAECFIPLTVGGGVRDNNDIRTLLLAGADKVSLNTVAVKEPEKVTAAARKFGSQCVVVALDVKRNAQGSFEIFTHGGRTPTGIDAVMHARRMEANGAGELLITSMDRDGTGKGFDVEVLKAMSRHVRIPIIASGGVGRPEHFSEAYRDGGATGLLAASIFHFGTYSISDVKQHMHASGIPVRKTGMADIS